VPTYKHQHKDTQLKTIAFYSNPQKANLKNKSKGQVKVVALAGTGSGEGGQGKGYYRCLTDLYREDRAERLT
jgi:hypothetical protein